MSRPTPTVSAGRALRPGPPAAGIPLDSAGLARLAGGADHRAASPTRCTTGGAGSIAGFMTVRKEGRRRGGWYWTVYRRAGGRLRKVYLGRSAAVTAGPAGGDRPGAAGRGDDAKGGATMDER